MNLDQFSGMMPLIPLAEMARHVKNFQIVPLLLISNRWAEAVMRAGTRCACSMSVYIRDDSVKCVFRYYMPDDPAFHAPEIPDFTVSFVDTGLQGEAAMAFLGETETRYTSGDMAALEEQCLRFLRSLSLVLLPVNYRKISVELYSTPPRFAMTVLSLLPRGTVVWTLIHVDEKYFVDSRQLVDFLRRVAFKEHGNAHISCVLDNLVQSEEIHLKSGFLHIDDARFLSGETMRNLECSKTEFGRTNWNSGHVNAFLRNWTERRESTVRKISIEIMVDQDINMNEVVRGLVTRRWHPSRRNGFLVEFLEEDTNEENPRPTDFRNALDVRNAAGQLGSIMLENGQLTFFAWQNNFPMTEYKDRLKERIKVMKEGLDQLHMMLGKLISEESNDYHRIETLKRESREKKERIDNAWGIVYIIRNEWQ